MEILTRAGVSKTAAQTWPCAECLNNNVWISTDCYYCGAAQTAPDAPVERFDDDTKGGTAQ